MSVPTNMPHVSYEHGPFCCCPMCRLVNRHVIPSTPQPNKQQPTTSPGKSGHLDEIQGQRQSVYGDPLKNHKGIAMMWATLLAPWWERIRDYEAVPPHVVALMLSALKLNRMRLDYHEDNYDDLAIYCNRFSQDWQKNKDTWGDGQGPDLSQ